MYGQTLFNKGRMMEIHHGVIHSQGGLNIHPTKSKQEHEQN